MRKNMPIKFFTIKLPALLIALLFFVFFAANSAYSYQTSIEEERRLGLKLNKLNIEVVDVFDPSESFYKYRIAKLANLLHINTKQPVIGRELLFLSDSLITPIRLSESANNLRDIGIFQWVVFEIDTLDGARGDLNVRAKDLFSADIGLAFSIEGGKIRSGIALKDFNLFGRGYKIRIGSSNRSDRRFIQTKFINPRFLGTRFVQKLNYIKFKDGELQYIELNRFFYSHETQWDMGSSYQKYSGKQYNYITSDKYVKSDHFWRGFHTFYGKYFGTDTRMRFGVRFIYVDENWTEPGAPYARHEWRSRKASVSFGGIKRNISVKQNIDFSDMDEDVHTGFLYNIGFGIDIPELGANTQRESYAIRTVYAKPFTPQDNIFFELAHGRVYHHKKDFSRITNVRLTCFSTRFRGHTIAANVRFKHMDLHQPLTQVFLGEGSGLRGYLFREFIGRRSLTINLEDRIFSNTQFWFVRLGWSLFIDSGKVWGDSIGFGAADWHTSIGIGIRLGIPKIAKGIVRLDFAFNMDKRKFSVPFLSNGSYFRVLYPIEIGVPNFVHGIIN